MLLVQLDENLAEGMGDARRVGAVQADDDTSAPVGDPAAELQQVATDRPALGEVRTMRPNNAATCFPATPVEVSATMARLRIALSSGW